MPGGLIFFGGPVVNPNPVGTVFEIVNSKDQGSNAMHWSFEAQGQFATSQRRYTNTLRVFTTSPLVGPIQVQQAVLGIGAVQGVTYKFPLPELINGVVTYPTGTGLPTEVDTGSFCQSIEITQDAEDLRQWKVVLEYTSFNIGHELGNSNVQNGSVNPLDAFPKVTWQNAKYPVNYPLDVNGLPFINAAGDPLEASADTATEETRQVLIFVRNEAQYNDAWASNYRDTVNSDTFLGYQPGQVKCRDIQGNRQYTTDYGVYWEVSYEFEFRIGQTIVVDSGEFSGNPTTQTTGWLAYILNQGLRQLVGGTGTPQQIMIDGALVTSPVPLQADGSYVPLSDTVDPYYLIFTLFQSSTFADLNIPDNVLTQNQ